MSYHPTFSTRLGDIDRNNTVYAESLTAFPLPAASVIEMEDLTHYTLTKPVNGETNQLKISDNGTIQISTTNAVANVLSTDLTGTTPFFFGNITRLEIGNTNILSNNSAGHCFDLSNNITPGFVFLDQASIQRFDSIGTIEGSSLSAENIGFVLNDAGITLNDMLFIVFRETSFAAQTGDHIILTGTLIGAIFDSNIATPSTGDALFNIDSGLAITNKILIHNNLFSNAAGGTLFDPAGLDQTDPKVIAFNNGNEVDSNWIGSLGFEDNATVTTISSIDTYVDISGTMTDVELERYTRSGGVLTSIGLEDIKALAQVNITASRDIPASSGRTVRAAVFVDTGSGFVEQGSASMNIRGDRTAYSFVVPLFLETNDEIKVQIKNEETLDNILVIDYNLTVAKL